MIGDGQKVTQNDIKGKGKGKSVPLQAWNSPDVYRNLRRPDFMTSQECGRLSA